MFEITFLYHIFIFRIIWVLKSYAFFRWSVYSIGHGSYFYYWNIGLQHVSFGISGTEFIIERIIILDLTIGARMLASLFIRTIHNSQLMRFESPCLLIIDSNNIIICSILMILKHRQMAFLLFDILTMPQSASNMPRMILRLFNYLPPVEFAVFNVCVVFLVKDSGCDVYRVCWWLRSILLRLSWISPAEVYDVCPALLFRGTIMRFINLFYRLQLVQFFAA